MNNLAFWFSAGMVVAALVRLTFALSLRTGPDRDFSVMTSTFATSFALACLSISLMVARGPA